MPFWSSKDASPARKYRFKVGNRNNINWWYASSVSLPSFEINTGEYQLINQVIKYPGIATWNDVTISVIDTAESVAEIKKMLAYYDFGQAIGTGQEQAIRKFDKTLLGAQAIAVANALAAQSDDVTGTTDSTLVSTREFEVYGSNEKGETKKQKGFDPSLELRNKGINYNLSRDEEKAIIDRAKAGAPGAPPFIVIEQMNGDGSTNRTWTLVNSFIKSVNYGDLSYDADELVSIEMVFAYDFATTEK